MIRAGYSQSCRWLIGHFGTCGGDIGLALRNVIPELLNRRPDCAILLIGRESTGSRAELVREYPALQDRIHATGSLSSSEISAHISACDIMVQPYPDGVSSRRSSLMAALSHGKAVVTTFGHLTEPFWHSSPSLALAPAGDYRQMIACIENLLANDVERERLARAAQILYDRRFSLPHVIESLRNQYDAGTRAAV